MNLYSSNNKRENLVDLIAQFNRKLKLDRVNEIKGRDNKLNWINYLITLLLVLLAMLGGGITYPY